MANQSFIDEYTNLLIKQYYEKPKAKAEVEAYASIFSDVYDFFNAFLPEFDIDEATGNRLDIIGGWVGISRIVPNILPKIYFGFSNNPNARGFGSINDLSRVGGPFKSIHESSRTNLQLSDVDYRFFILVKIARNSCRAVMKNDTFTSLQDVIQLIFPEGAYVVDTLNMGLNLYLYGDVVLQKLEILISLDLLPRPQAVRYNIINLPKLPAFGFSNNVKSAGFGSLNNPARVGGYFARIVDI